MIRLQSYKKSPEFYKEPNKNPNILYNFAPDWQDKTIVVLKSMDYKKIFRSARMRQKIMKALSFVPDSIMIRLQYLIKLHRLPNLKNPRRFTEKVQLYKMYYRNDDLGRIVDKYEVRNYLKDKGINANFPELYGVFDRAEDIDFTALPKRFVIKTNDGGGGDNIVICRDKDLLDIPATVKRVNSWLEKKNANAGREWAYTQIAKSRIVVEEFLENKENPEGGLEDYKIFCYDGEPFCIVVDGERYIGHKRNFYDLEWRNLHIGSDCANFQGDTPRPDNLDQMLTVASKLSKGFPFVRVDLYSVMGKVYFGEMTFYPWSGYVQYTPDEFDMRLGEKFDTSTFISKKRLRH